MPILHESQGLRITRNPKNSFIIVTLRYDADPAKRSPEWYREASAGMTPEKAAREYNIDYTAILGSKVFPEIVEKRSQIIIPPLDPDSVGRCWGGFDYGLRNPSSFHVYTIIDGVIISLWELYEPCSNIGDFATKMRSSPYWNKIRYIAADPSIWTPMQQQAIGAPISVKDLFYREGVRTFVKGRNDGSAEESWLALMREYWSGDEIGFQISRECREQIKEFETSIFSYQSERQLLSSVYRESIQDRNNHSLDDCKYFMLTQPSRSGHQQSEWKSPIMVNKWAVGSKSPSHPLPAGKPAKTGPRTAIGGYI